MQCSDFNASSGVHVQKPRRLRRGSLLAFKVWIVGWQIPGFMPPLTVGRSDDELHRLASALAHLELDWLIVIVLADKVVLVAVAAAARQDFECADSPVSVVR